MTQRASFIEQLQRRWVEADTLLCVGLDPDPARLPQHLARDNDGLFEFCAAIVDATASYVCAFKPQFAYFAAQGAEPQLARLIAHIHRQHPGIPVILDAKRGDIGDTARFYAIEAFERYDADAVTVNPYLGRESVEPFLAYADRGVFLLCRTSNPDSAWLQNHPPDDPAYLRVARDAAAWNRHGNLMFVAGATYADDLRRIREAVGDAALLVPGIGAQGGDLAAVLGAGLNARGHGLLINAARSVLYAGEGADYAAAAAGAAGKLRDEIRGLGRDLA